MKTVIHISSNNSDKIAEAVANARNLLQDPTVEDPEIAILLNADAVKAARKDSAAEKYFQELLDKEVQIKACNNSLESREIKEKELLQRVEAVPSGIGELTKLQTDGYAYIRP
ncbi:DsrE family protein [Candidatus Nanohalovita haloferacivicina]|uniref:DsrE family protein n=1 Tax=Candidatus Nanohalovita haloferacivicina TaxID=2978046 RepID=UPI00325FA36B|nr:DsrE/DsrF family protein [Candidatus Nanohalobia archaeon BNXNv]